jgi:hypothetical protein
MEPRINYMKVAPGVIEAMLDFQTICGRAGSKSLCSI